MNTIGMGELIANYAVVQDVIETTKNEMKELLDQVKQSEEYLRLESWLSINVQSYEQLGEKIKEIALEEFNKTGQKKIIDGIGIREMTKFLYDVDQALEWAKKEMPAILQIDKKQFELYLKSAEKVGKELPANAKMLKVPSVTIAADLSAYKQKLIDIGPGPQPPAMSEEDMNNILSGPEEKPDDEQPF